MNKKPPEEAELRTPRQQAHDLLNWGLVIMACKPGRTLRLSATPKQMTLSILVDNKVIARKTRRDRRNKPSDDHDNPNDTGPHCSP